MTQQTIRVGTINGKNGDSLYAAFTKVNANFTDLYTKTNYSSIAGSLIPSADVTYDLGSPTNQWRHLYVSENTIYVGGQALTVSENGDVIVNGEVIATPGGGATWNSVIGKPDLILNADTGALTPGDMFFTQTTDTVSMGQLGGQNITAGPSGIQIAGTGGVTIMGVATSTVTLGGQTSGNINFVSPTTGINYDHLDNKPAIPADVADLTDNSNLLSGGGTPSAIAQGSYEVSIDTLGNVSYPGGITQSSQDYTICPPNVETVIYTSTAQFQHAIKLFVMVEGMTDPGGTPWDTQACDIIAVKGYINDIVHVTTYGVTYSGATAIATFDGQWNATTSRIEITCSPVSVTNDVTVSVHAIEIQSND